MGRFEIGEHDFLLDGEPQQIIAGAIHYTRVHPDLWRDRVRKAKQMGLNTIETYVIWNAHFRERDRPDFSGGRDLGRFLDIVAEEGLLAIVRPGPYACAEWDNGGLPAWLFADPDVGIRRYEPKFMAAVTAYFAAILPIVVERQIDRGGPVILVQVENEYGAYGSDTAYLVALRELLRGFGVTVPLTTVDQADDRMLSNGGLAEVHRTASFGSRPEERLATLRRHQPTGPLMCSEFWIGWFDHWGAHHHKTAVEQSATDLEVMLAAGASVNIYMFHGGTNFGFTNGANHKGILQPTTTSYDYDAPLDELGNPTAKYRAFQQVIARHRGVELPEVAATIRPSNFTCELDRARSLAHVSLTGAWRRSDSLPTMDSLEIWHGFAVYRTPITGGGLLAVHRIRDRAQVYVDGKPVGTLSRDAHERSIMLPPGRELELLVEDQGRVNYGERLGEAKGLLGPATLNGETLEHWSVLGLDLDRPPEVVGSDFAALGPKFFAGTFDAAEGQDLVLDTALWGKGIVWVNGFSLGRYWSKGPQRSLVVPGPIVKATHNEIVVFEQHTLRARRAIFISELALGHTEE